MRVRRPHLQPSSSAKADDPVFQRRLLSNREAAAYWIARFRGRRRLLCSGSSFRGDAKHRIRNLEIPRCAIGPLRFPPSTAPRLTLQLKPTTAPPTPCPPPPHP